MIIFLPDVLNISVIIAGVIHKSTLMSQLNTKPEISKERLKRVQTRGQNFQLPPDTLETGPEVARHQDVALLVKRGARYTYTIGRVLRIRNQGKSGRIEYRRSIPLSDTHKYDQVKVLIREYTPRRRNYVYNKSLSLAHTKEYSIKAVIMPVNMDYVHTSEFYSLEPSDREQLNQFVADKNKVGTQKSKQKQVANVSQYMEDDGVRRQTITLPGKRTRIVRTFNS